MNFVFIQIFFFFILFQSELNENINNKQDKIPRKEKKSEIINLTDKNFDTYINNGKYNRWLILFYIETCYYCEKAIQILNNILYKNKFKVVNNIKFGIIDVSINTQINFRFNISQVPQIILIENNSMIELDLYPNEKNFINFIESNFSDSKSIFPIPKINLFKYYYISLDNSVYYFVEKVNDFLKSYNINHAINPIVFISLYIIVCIFFWIIIFKGYFKFIDYIKKTKTKKEKEVGDVNPNKSDDVNSNKSDDINDKENNNSLKKNKYFRKRRIKK